MAEHDHQKCADANSARPESAKPIAKPESIPADPPVRPIPPGIIFRRDSDTSRASNARERDKA
ncbi:MAG: hypothetical protein ABIQ57_11490 [Candidatus Kapaibacterium sp.]